jgi:hypothetical protein
VTGPDARTGTAVPASLWRHQDFRRLWIGDTISQVGTQLSLIALPVLAVTVLGAGPVEMGVLTALETVAFLVIGLPAGAWVDRWRKKRVLVVNDLVRAVAFASVPLAWATGTLTLWQVYAVALVVGAATVFFDVAYQSYLPSLVSGDQLVDGNAKLQASQSVAMVGGPAVGGVLLRFVSAPVLLGLDALSFVVSALFVGRIRQEDSPPARADRRPLRTEIAEGLSFVVRQPLLRRIVACTSISNYFSSVSGALFALLLLRELGLGTESVGLAFAFSAVGGLLGAVVTSRVVRVVGEGRTIPVSAIGFAAFAVVTPLAAVLAPRVPPLPLIAAGGFGMFLWVVVYNITQVSFRQRLCPPALLGRMNASVRFIVFGTMPLGGLTGGLLGASIGVVPTFWVAAAGAWISVLPVLFSPLSTMRDLPRELEAPSA